MAIQANHYAVDSGKDSLSQSLRGGNSMESGRAGYRLVLAYLFLEYLRPMDFVPALAAIRPGLIVTVLLVICWGKDGVWRAVINPQPQIAAVYWMVGIMVVFIPIATNNYYAYQTTVIVVLYLPFMISVLIYVNTVARLEGLARCWLLLAACLAMKGILWKGVAGSYFLADENDYSLLMNMMLPFGYFMFKYEKLLWRKSLCLISLILASGSIVASFSRGGFVGLVMVGVVIWMLSPQKVLSLALVASIALGVFVLSDKKYWEEMQTVTDTSESTASERLNSWAAAWDMFLDYPLGVGPGNFPVHFEEYQPAEMQRGMWGRAAHSLWFTLLSELGIMGVGVYFMLLYFNIRDCLHIRNNKYIAPRLVYFLSLAYLASMVGYFASGTFISVLYYPHYFYLTAMIVSSRSLLIRQGLSLMSANEIRNA